MKKLLAILLLFPTVLSAANSPYIWFGKYAKDLTASGVQEPAGTSALPSYTFAGNTADGIYAPATNVMGFVTSGAEVMRIDASGNVGIGTTSPAVALDVVGDIRAEGGNHTATIRAQGGVGVYIGASTNSSIFFTSGGANVGNFSSGKLYLGSGFGAAQSKLDVNGGVAIGSYAGTNTAPSNGLIVSGNVGIGTATPGTLLDLAGAFTERGIAAPSLSSAGQGIIYFDSTANKFEYSENGGAYAGLTNSNLSQYNIDIGNNSNVRTATNTNLLGRINAQNDSQTVTITNASPAVLTITSHGFSNFDTVYLTTTGGLPTGLSASTKYVVTIIDPNTFNVSTSVNAAAAGTFVNTSSAGSGVHTATHGGLVPTVSSIVNADISAGAAIAGSKLVAAASGVSGAVSTGTQTFTGAKTFETSIALATSGGTASALNYYEAGTSGSTTGTGGTFTMNSSSNASSNVDVAFTRIGDVVMLSFPAITATAAAGDTHLTWGTTLLTRLRPSATQYFPVENSEAATVTKPTPAYFIIQSNGQVFLYQDAAGTAYGVGASGVTGNISVSYKI